MISRPATWTAAHWLRALLVLYAVAAVVITVQRAVVGNENNFDTFRASVGHLRSGADLYAAYPAEHADRFKYSPSFPVLFAPFSVDPKWLGFFAWTLLSLGALAWALVRLLPTRGAAIALAIVLFEAIGSAQRAQTNALVAALMIAAFLALEGDR
ncbi:MAG: DUF2029 domain-containing protein, partial [Gemmatimonadaceae bacterium]|nr:DUF2029 domain-containing protein [Gemmatimonadaceae bacterium]